MPIRATSITHQENPEMGDQIIVSLVADSEGQVRAVNTALGIKTDPNLQPTDILSDGSPMYSIGNVTLSKADVENHAEARTAKGAGYFTFDIPKHNINTPNYTLAAADLLFRKLVQEMPGSTVKLYGEEISLFVPEQSIAI